MDAATLAGLVAEGLEVGALAQQVERVRTFEDFGIASAAPGLVVEFQDGSTVQITFAQTKHSPVAVTGRR